MAIPVNGERIPDALVTHEFEHLLKTQKAGNPDPDQLRLMAACAVVDRVLIRQAADRDPRPVDPVEVEALMRREMQSAGCRAGVNEDSMRHIAEQRLRFERTMDGLAGEFAGPTTDEVMDFYRGLQSHFPAVSKADAAHGGLEGVTYPWGDDLTPGGEHRANIWQGEFPDLDLALDGHSRPASVRAYQPNAFGLYNMCGNVWEWCNDYFDTEWREVETPVNPAGPAEGVSRVMKGGSYLCHHSYCFRYRVSARTSNAPESATGNIGFRVARDCS